MSSAAWVVLAVSAWLVLPFPLAVLIGRAFVAADRAGRQDAVVLALEAQVGEEHASAG